MRFISGPIAAAALVIGLGAAQGAVRVDIDLSTQRMHVSSGSGTEYDWAVSTGRPGHRTPSGVFHPQALYEMAHSNKYDNAPMPHAIFFADGGYAIHGTYATGALGGVASHGCVRLAPGNAATLFAMVRREGATIVISGSAPGGERIAQRERVRVEDEPEDVAPVGWSDESFGYAPAPRRRAVRSWAEYPLGDF